MNVIAFINSNGGRGKSTIANGLGVSKYEPDGKACEEIRALYSELKERLGG
ncbi:MAG: hypothetical protein ACYSTS_18960 [Planctomycetota bacterium]|jgi:MinD-like ATPase involved in chromosome partitioning or flagellar assembly